MYIILTIFQICGMNILIFLWTLPASGASPAIKILKVFHPTEVRPTFYESSVPMLYNIKVPQIENIIVSEKKDCSHKQICPLLKQLDKLLGNTGNGIKNGLGKDRVKRGLNFIADIEHW